MCRNLPAHFIVLGFGAGRFFCHAERAERLLVKCCHLQPAGQLLATCPSVFSVPSERRLTDKPGCLAAVDPPPPREEELSHPSAGPDTTAPPTKHLFTPKHQGEEGSVSLTLRLRGPPSWGQSNRLQGPAYLSVLISALTPTTSPAFKAATEKLRPQQ